MANLMKQDYEMMARYILRNIELRSMLRNAKTDKERRRVKEEEDFINGMLELMARRATGMYGEIPEKSMMYETR